MTRENYPEALLSSLSAVDTATRLKSLRALKNAIIGNKRLKVSCLKLGAVQALLDILSTEQDGSLLVQATQALGSFAVAGPAAEVAVAVVVQQGGIPCLLKALRSEDERVVEAAVRSLKLVYKSPAAPAEAIFSSEGALTTLVTHLTSPAGNLAECAASILASCCSGERQVALASAGVMDPLVAMLSSGQRSKQEAALEALAALTEDNPSAAAALLRHKGVLHELLGFAKHAAAPRVRFVACVCLINLRELVLREPVEGDSSHLECEAVEAVVLPVLARLLGDPAVGPEVPPALIRLTWDSPELQKAAADADVISQLAALLRDAACAPQRRAGALSALAMLCSHHEEHRRQLVDCGSLPAVAAALSDSSSHAVRAAACACVRSLTRSMRLLRGALGALGDIASPLLELTRCESDHDVAVLAAAALANMAVEYSAVKQQLLASDGVARFGELAASSDDGLRLYGVWGLSSCVYMADCQVKLAVMKQLGWQRAAALLEDPSEAVREKAMQLVRNLAYNTPADVAAVLSWSGGGVLGACRTAMERPGASAQLKQHALYVAANAASGSAAHKEAVMAAGWPSVLAGALGDSGAVVREAAVWAVINLSWSRDGEDEAVGLRMNALRALGVEQRLEALWRDECLAVRERAKTALEQFRPPAAPAAAAAGRPRDSSSLPELTYSDEEEEEEDGNGGDTEVDDGDAEIADLELDEIDQDVEVGGYF